jgi:hypothetical protein
MFRDDSVKGVGQSEPERTVGETVERLSRRCLPHLVGPAVDESLIDFGFHFEAAVVHIERQRNLADKEFALRRAFGMLLDITA